MNHLTYHSEKLKAANSKIKMSFIAANGDWLYFSHVKKAIRDADWTYRFLHM